MRSVFDGRLTGGDETVLAYLRGYLQEDILVKIDRASMATSLEVRSPFLDPDLVEFALGLPINLRLRGRTGKYVLRNLMRQRLPDALIDRRKVGFGVPLNQWLRESQRELLQDLLSPSRLRAQDIFDARAVGKLVSAHLDGRANHGHELWLLLLFQLWHQRWMRASQTTPSLPTAAF
jgi:asparagine synthase (glutamine-hydrolysing)